MKIIYTLLLVGLLTVAGCGKKADTTTPIADVKQESSTMSVEDLKSKASEYQKAIQAKMAELEPITNKLAALPMTEKMGDEAQALQGDIAKITEDLSALKERLNVYLDALKEQGESVKEYMQ